MKIFFQKNDSLYKIFKTLEKVSTNKDIHIHIDPEHSFFDNQRRGKQLKELIQERKLDAYFITKNDKSKYFFQSLGLKIIHQEKSKIIRIFNVIYLFFFNFKRFHLLAYNRKNYIFYVVFGFEVAFILTVFYLLYSLVLHSSNIYIKTSQQSENIIYNFRYYPSNDLEYQKDSRFISIPIYSGSIQHKYELSISTANIKYIQNPSRGEVTIVNRTEKKYSFVPKTRLVTDDGRLFQTITWNEIPAGSENQPSQTNVKIKAMEKDDNGVFMGSRGNISIGTRLYVKNLNQSIYLKKVYAEVVQDITGGSLSSQGTISEKDISILSGKLSDYILQNKKEIVGNNFKIDNGVLLGFNDTISLYTKEMYIKNKTGEQSPLIQGYILADIHFYYIQRDDLIKGFSEYIKQRPSEKAKLITIDRNSLVFFDSIKKEGEIFIIPTKIDIIQGYDFNKDINGILNNIKDDIVSKDKNEVEKIILSYPEVAGVQIKIRPPRYNTLPTLKSRIKFIFE